jgi:hydroxymethylpyrimidine pyrophosphatase-like HAD family hydrolase
MQKPLAFLQQNRGFRQVANRPPSNNIPSDKKVYIIDIDGTICSKTNSDYTSANPIFENIDKFNYLYEKGHQIHYWTARGALSGKNWDAFTVKQLKSWNVKYNTINMGKPHYDVWIDDKAINVHHFCDF